MPKREPAVPAGSLYVLECLVVFEIFYSNRAARKGEECRVLVLMKLKPSLIHLSCLKVVLFGKEML